MLAPFVRTDSGHHATIDIAGLLKFFHDQPLDVWNITSPNDLVSWEVLRERHGITDPLLGVPCDLFVWGTGEPPDRRLTRIGGTPWLPKHMPWPSIGKVVSTFLCQFDFRDSLDLVGNLPGDLLLVFVADEDALHAGDAKKMRFLWVSANETDIFEPADIPAPTDPFQFVCAWGARFRTADFPSRWKQAYSIPDNSSGRVSSLPVLWGTKIGGVPYHSQENQYSAPAHYLCQLVSVQPSAGTPWPWVNQEASLTSDFTDDGMHGRKNNLMIGDMGELTFFLQKNGSIRVESACG